jgi:hypothetical protein
MEDSHKLKLQLGRKKRYLLNCIKVQELLSRYETKCTIRVRIYNEYIKPAINGLSYAQFNNIINERNPAKQLEEIEEQLKQL